MRFAPLKENAYELSLEPMSAPGAEGNGLRYLTLS